jgi:Do/DeqQ family serine protease
MMDTSKHNKTQASSRFSWKQPAVYLLLLLIGAGAAFTGDRVLRQDSVLFPKSQEDSDQPLNVIPPQSATPRTSAIPPIAVDSNFIVDAVEKVGPAVVSIEASRTVNSSRPDFFFEDPFFGPFFGRRPPSQPRQRLERGTGSGFIISSEGQILTNAHVIDGADVVEVTLKDGRSFTGKVLGADPVTDVAVVKIEAQDLPSVTIGNSDALQPGEWAIAIGNPLGLDNTVTAGIVSATDRSSSQVGVPDKRVGFIQTDAAINPGNSGGPLLNAAGEVVGMNTAIIQGAQGLGFAIPMKTVEQIAQQLITKGKVEHPYLGIQMVTLSPEIKQEINSDPNSGIQVKADQGVLIGKVVEGSPAAKAGLRAGDVIQKMNNRSIQQAETVQEIVQATTIGNSIDIQINRNGNTINLSIQPGPMPLQSE